MSGEPQQPRPAGGCIVIAHRGASHVAPENTFAAVRAAVAGGADACEVDVRETKDGQLVLMHDASLDRTTDGSGLLREATLEEVRRLDAGSWKGRAFAGEQVPTLGETLAVLGSDNCAAVVELKEPATAASVADEIIGAGMQDQTVLICFEPACLRELSEVEPRLRLGLLLEEELTGSAAERADLLVSRAEVCGASILDLHYSMLDDGLIGSLHRRGILVWTWTVNDPDVYSRLQRRGADGVTTDRPHDIRT